MSRLNDLANARFCYRCWNKAIWTRWRMNSTENRRISLLVSTISLRLSTESEVIRSHSMNGVKLNICISRSSTTTWTRSRTNWRSIWRNSGKPLRIIQSWWRVSCAWWTRCRWMWQAMQGIVHCIWLVCWSSLKCSWKRSFWREPSIWIVCSRARVQRMQSLCCSRSRKVSLFWIRRVWSGSKLSRISRIPWRRMGRIHAFFR